MTGCFSSLPTLALNDQIVKSQPRRGDRRWICLNGPLDIVMHREKTALKTLIKDNFHPVGRDDTVSWRWDKSGNVSVKFIYELLMDCGVRSKTTPPFWEPRPD